MFSSTPLDKDPGHNLQLKKSSSASGNFFKFINSSSIRAVFRTLVRLSWKFIRQKRYLLFTS